LEFLTVRVSAIYNSAYAVVENDDPLPHRDLECDRCHDPEESVVATMRIPEMEPEWALCALCLRGIDVKVMFHSTMFLPVAGSYGGIFLDDVGGN
jgi:hypothetical protein